MTNGHDSGGAVSSQRPNKTLTKVAISQQASPPNKEARNQKGNEREQKATRRT